MPPNGLMDRLLAKMALEAMAHRLIDFPEAIEEVILDRQLDEIRHFARTGMKPKVWPYHQRRLYDANRKFEDEEGQDVQTLHEFDFLLTEGQEYFFVIAIFGIEYAINMGGPEIDGYQRWLNKYNEQSVLYLDKKDLYSTSAFSKFWFR